MKKAIKRGWKLKSRILALMLVISMVVSLLPVNLLSVQQATAAESSGFQNINLTDGFQDVSPMDWFYDAAVYVQKNGIFNGTGVDTFSPQGTMTRAMYVTALGRMAGVDVSDYPISTFADVQTGIWYAPYVEWAVKKGITVGTGNGNFSPDATVSREQMVTMTLRYFESHQISYQTSNHVTTKPSDLANVSSWAVDAVIKLWQAGLFVGDATGNFNPHDQATRAQAAVTFMRSNAVVEAWQGQNQATPKPTPTPAPTPTPEPSSNTGGNSGGGGISITEYALTFESNGGTAVTGQTVKYGSKAAVPEVPTKEGYTFGGWFSDSSLAIPYGFTEAVTGKLTLYAKWTIKSFTVSFDSNGGPIFNSQPVNYGGTVTEPDAPTREGYTFGGWYSDSSLTIGYSFTTPVTDNMTLYAKWTARYTVSFNSNGGSAMADQTVNEGANAAAPSAPTKNGYVFSGWYSDRDLTIAYDFTTAVVKGNITLYAKWTIDKKNSYTVSFNSNGGTEVAGQTVEEGAVASAPGAPIKEGHTFGGWYSDSKLANAYGFTAAVTGNITLYAKWTINSYIVSFNSNSGSSVNSQSVNYGGSAATPDAPTRTGHTFEGWYSDSKLANAYGFTAAVTGNITLYAKWTINSYTVSFNSNSGSSVNSQSVNYGGSAATPDAPTRAGYTFDGWYSDSDLRSPYGFTAAVTGDIMLHAKWIANNYTVSFDSNGGTAVAAQTMSAGEALSKLPAPTKVGYIFQGWFRDSDFSLIFAEGSTISEDTKLYAKYLDSVDNAVQTTPSHSVLDVSPNFTIAVIDASGNLTASEVKAGMTFKDTANPDFAGITVTEGNGHFAVDSAAEDGKFVEGNTYQLTLKDDNLSFRGQDASTRIYVFSVAKQEVMNIPLNPNMIYLAFAEVSDMMLDGANVDSPAIPVVTTTVGSSGNTLAEANASSGTFVYSGSAAIKVGDTVAIYQGASPDLRTVETTGEDDGDVAYVQITAVNGTTYTYGRADANQVLFKPDVLPVSIEADTDGDPDNNSITVEHSVMNYSDSMYEPLGLDELTTLDVGDFIGFYEGEFAINGEFADEDLRVVSYGRITSVTRAAEMDIITYTDATVEDISNSFNLYQEQAINGDVLLSEGQIAQLESQIEQQAIDSGFVDQAANYLSAIAMETNDFKAQSKVGILSGDTVTVENLTVVASLGTKLKNINGRTSGVSATLQVGADIVVNGEEGALVIHMTGTFVQEMSLDLGVNSETKWHWYTINTFFGRVPLFPVIDDYVITANLDAYSYTGLNIKAEMALVEHDKLGAALDDWLDAKTSGLFSQVRDIATEIEAIMAGVQDTAVDVETLKEQYKEMLEQDTEWVPLIEQEIFEASMRVALGIVEIKFEAKFVVSAQVNLTIGADFYYKMAKRYSVTLRVLSFSGTSNTVSLPGDGDYQFTFYVMGTLGLRAGINLEVKAGIGSVELNSIGLSVEPGVYMNLWGYFYYQLKNVSGVKSTRSIGALYVEVGIYLEVELGAQLGDGMLSTSVELVDEKWPLYTIGESNNVYNFVYSQDESPILNMASRASSVEVPEMLFTMRKFDLRTGETDTETYDLSRFDIQVDNPNFKYDPKTQKIEVVDKKIAVSEGNLVITWKGAPLSFTSEPLRRKIPLNWLARTGDYILQLYPRNGGATQVIAAPYNAAISVTDLEYTGYTFDGWYTAPTGGTKITIPSQMPAEDMILFARWIANTNTPYTVKHYLIDPNTGTSTSPVITENLTGTTDTRIVINSERFKDQGYTNGTVSGALLKGDATTALRVEYYPTNRKMTFSLGYEGASTGSSITEPFGKNIAGRIPVPTRPGYTFAGWSPEVPSVMPTTDTTYTARWTAKTDTPYQVVHLQQDINIHSGTYTVVDKESYRGTTDTTVNSADVTPKVYEGFTFDPTAAQTANIASDGSTVLKLYYKRNSYAMTINYNGSGEASKVVNVPFGATTGIYLGTPVWQGSTFTEWLSNPPSATPSATMPAHNVEFTAQWTRNGYTVSFNSNGGSPVSNQTVEYGSQASKPDQPTKEDLVFGGWYRDSNLQTVYVFSAPITANLTLYAKWLRGYTVSFDSNGGSAVADQKVNEGDKAAAPAAPTKEDFVFSGWYSDSDLTIAYDFEVNTVTRSFPLYAKWTSTPKVSYTVSFNSRGGSQVAPLTVYEGAVAAQPVAPTQEGLTFVGWYDSSSLTNPFSFSTPIVQNLTLYAKWTDNIYTVSFNSNGGSAVDSKSVIHRNTVAQPTAPTREDHRFDGWFSDIELNNRYIFSTSVMADLTLYAKWTAIYTVSFNNNGGPPVADVKVPRDIMVYPPDPTTRAGYTFGGWHSDSELTNRYRFDTPVTGNLTLYALWTLNVHTVTFNSNGGPVVESQAVVPGSSAVAPAVPNRVGYKFEGWYSNSNLTTVYNFSAKVTTNLTLYAKWTETSWLKVGDATNAGARNLSKVVLDRQGTPYVAYVTRTNELFVLKYANNEWLPVGGLNALDQPASTSGITLAIDSQNNLYVAYLAQSLKFIVKKYNGDIWESVGSIEERGNYPSIAFDKADIPYMAYIDEAEVTSKTVYVVRYKDGAWEKIDSRWESSASNPVIAVDRSNIPYLFYTYRSSSGVKTTVVKYEGEDLTQNWISDSEFSTIGMWDASFALDPSGVPYVAYMSSSSKVTVMKYMGSTWEPVGTSGFSITSDSSNDLLTSIAFDSLGNPYVAYRDAAHGGKVTVMKYGGGSWSPVEYAGISDDNVFWIRLAVDSNNDIYVSYIAGPYSEGKVSVMKYDPDLHQP
ncbi:InlB B-repeat-containing protein [Paenibacillus sp. FSL H8-0548]|uniref:InlB B-repeat-containing protein n=1 Tax=Paenibacillus sp. FSL H8-0548 TaxID=1920422 RepID=UPI0015C306CD|nr:InlB B-repeat-containing protein [Paenibacillus sp. FSL H8-0548]